ncbi:DoxX family membrane protein [Pseudoalteromonas sp. XMcav11-Q]|uniref:DoxX family membrane protein n=1 Tax=Pseudoalteromonas sp. XMcav11-Q TaxID=3136665 RepID=UPI0032C46DC4
MASSGLLSELLPLVIAFELIGGLFILAGAFTQLTAIAFAGFSIVSALLFHFDLADQIQFFFFLILQWLVAFSHSPRQVLVNSALIVS